MTANKWWLKPTAILAHFHKINQAPEHDPRALDRLVRWKLKSGFDAEHLLLNYTMLEGKGGDDSRAYLFRNFHGFKEDWLSLYLPIAQKHGLRVLVYFNCHWFKPDTFPSDYYVVDASGKPKVIYGDGGQICCRGPFRAWSKAFAEDLGRYPIDGVFLDGPVKDACWCVHCRAAHQALFGSPINAQLAACPPEHAEKFEAFRREMATGYIQAFAEGLHRHNPGAVIYCNGGDARQMKETLPWTQLVGAEGGFIGYAPLAGEFPFAPGRIARGLEACAHGRGRVVFCDCGFKRFDYHVHPKTEIARMYAGTISHGASPWFLIWKDAVKSPGIQTALQFNRLLRKHREDLADGCSLAEAAILRSHSNMELAGATSAASGDDVNLESAGRKRLAAPKHAWEFNGLYAAMARSGYPFDIIEEDALFDDERLPRYRLIILPGISALSDAAAARIRLFVRQGGRILATFDTGLFDEQGIQRSDFALADVFGIRPGAVLAGPSTLDYMAVSGKHALTAGLSQAILPCPEYRWLVLPKASTKTLLRFYEPMSRRYAALPEISRYPAATLNRFGKGLALFFPCSIGDLSLRYRFPDMRKLLINAARFLAPPPIDITGAPDEFVETSLRRGASGAITAHLINWASGERPAERAIPLGPIRVSIRLPRNFTKPKTARLAMAGINVGCCMKNRRLCFEVRNLEEYEMAVVST